jgi:TPR repeat protein
MNRPCTHLSLLSNCITKRQNTSYVCQVLASRLVRCSSNRSTSNRIVARTRCDWYTVNESTLQRPFMLHSTTRSSITVSDTRSLSNISSATDSESGDAVITTEDTTITTASSSSLDPKQTGEELYQDYLKVWNELEALKKEQERITSEKMFEAWKRTQPPPETNPDDASTTTTNISGTSGSNKGTTNNTSPRNNAGGVAVVRTLAREVTKNRNADPVQKLETRASNLLQIAGIKYKHPKALIALANMEIQQVLTDLISSTSSANVVVNHSLIREKVTPCLQYYEIAGEAGVSEGYYNLGHMYWDGVDGLIESDRVLAMNYMQKAIHLGDIDAMYLVGVHRLGHRSEFRIDQLQKALSWVEQAAEQKHGGALKALAVLYMRGYKELNISPCPDEEFHRRLTLAIEYDDNGSAHWLRSLAYENGSHGYPMDVVLWFNDLVKAAELGHANACLNVGVAYFLGFQDKIVKDQERAFQYYQRAGELGNIEGWRNVVDCYATGQGVKQNVEMAKYIGETMIRPYDETEQHDENTAENEEAFDDINESDTDKKQ